MEGRGKGAGFLITPVSINTLIGFKLVPQIIQVFICTGKCRPKGHKVPLGKFSVNVLCYILRLFILISYL